MKAKPKLEHSMQEEQIRAVLNAHWHASAVGDANAEHDIFDDDAICDYPHSGERIFGEWRRHCAEGVKKSTGCHPERSEVSPQLLWLKLLRGTAEMLRCAQHDRFEFFHSFLWSLGPSAK